jgi:hypothetical protein
VRRRRWFDPPRRRQVLDALCNLFLAAGLLITLWSLLVLAHGLGL